MFPLIPTVSAFVGGLVAKEVLFPTVAPPTRVVTQYVPVAAPPAWEPERPAMAYVGTQSGFKQALAMSTLKQQQMDAALKARAHAPPPAETTPPPAATTIPISSANLQSAATNFRRAMAFARAHGLVTAGALIQNARGPLVGVRPNRMPSFVGIYEVGFSDATSTSPYYPVVEFTISGAQTEAHRYRVLPKQDVAESVAYDLGYIDFLMKRSNRAARWQGDVWFDPLSELP